MAVDLMDSAEEFAQSKLECQSLRRTSGGSSSANRRSMYVKRDEPDFTEDEMEHLDNLKNNSKLSVFSVFKGPTDQLQSWLYFFDGTDEHHAYGTEMQQGFVYLWSTFIVMEALLAGVAIQPFISTQDLQGWKLTWYGLLWMLSILANFFALAATALFLGFLLGNPGKLTWMWLCKIGMLRGIPGLLMLLATFMSLAAIGFTTFVLYGWRAGVVCMVFEGLIVGACVALASVLGSASGQVIQSQLKTL